MDGYLPAAATTFAAHTRLGQPFVHHPPPIGDVEEIVSPPDWMIVAQPLEVFKQTGALNIPGANNEVVHIIVEFVPEVHLKTGGAGCTTQQTITYKQKHVKFTHLTIIYKTTQLLTTLHSKCS